jgi:hypothetical protein
MARRPVFGYQARIVRNGLHFELTFRAKQADAIAAAVKYSNESGEPTEVKNTRNGLIVWRSANHPEETGK